MKAKQPDMKQFIAGLHEIYVQHSKPVSLEFDYLMFKDGLFDKVKH